MQSRRDQVEAQSYLLSRLTGALVLADPDTVEPPTRRDSRGFLTGLMVALLAVGLVAVVVMFFGKGSTKWQQPNVLITSKTDGSRYLLVDGQLRPVLNLASARLVRPNLSPVSVNPNVLKNIPRGE